MVSNTSVQDRHAVVLGGAGFLGSHLCDRLVDLGARVTVIDNLITGRTDNLDQLFGESGFKFVEYDVTNYLHVPGAVDYVIHFASPASPVDYLTWPIQTLKVGSLGTHKALGLARAKGARLLLASTSEVYGDPLVNPQPETYWGNVNPVGPRGVYDEAKRFAEAMSLAYHRQHGVEVRIARIFNTYGPRMRLEDGRAIPAFFAERVEERTPSNTRRWDANAIALLCRRSDRRDRCVATERLHGPGQYRKRSGSHHSRTRQRRTGRRWVAPGRRNAPATGRRP